VKSIRMGVLLVLLLLGGCAGTYGTYYSPGYDYDYGPYYGTEPYPYYDYGYGYGYQYPFFGFGFSNPHRDYDRGYRHDRDRGLERHRSEGRSFGHEGRTEHHEREGREH